MISSWPSWTGAAPGGDPLVGTFNQNGGSVTVTHQMMIGSDATNSGLYGWGSGTSGGRGDGTYNFNGGTLAGGGSMIVRYDAPATGTFQGQGAVGLTGTLTNNGRMIADGGLLDLSSFTRGEEHRCQHRRQRQHQQRLVRHQRRPTQVARDRCHRRRRVHLGRGPEPGEQRAVHVCRPQP